MRKVLLLGMLCLLGGCVSPYAKMDSADVRMLAQDRYVAAADMPVCPKEKAFHKVYALDESVEAIDNIRDKDAEVELDGTSYAPGPAHRYVRRQVVKTEQGAGITTLDYAGKVGKWFVGIPVTVFLTPVQAVQTLVDSPVM